MLFTPPKKFDSARWNNMRIGLLGGSFNPPHAGHVYISRLALKRLRLDAVWWLVTPQNPFKSNAETLSFERRLDLCRDIARDQRIIISDLEQRFQLHRTIDTVDFVTKHYSNTDFVWLTGMDLVAEIPKWKNWKALLDKIAFAHVIRPPTPSIVRNSVMHQRSTQRHIFNPNTQDHRNIKLLPSHTYWILDARGHTASSTEIREKLDLYAR